MTREQLQKAIADLAKRDSTFAAIPPFAMLSPRETAALLNIPMGSLKNRRQGTDVLSRIDVSCEGAKRKTYQFNRREVVGLLIARQQKVQKAPADFALLVYHRLA